MKVIVRSLLIGVSSLMIIVLFQNCSGIDADTNDLDSAVEQMFKQALVDDLQNPSDLNQENNVANIEPTENSFSCWFDISVTAAAGEILTLAPIMHAAFLPSPVEKIEVIQAPSILGCVERARIGQAVSRICSTTYFVAESGRPSLPAFGTIKSRYQRFSGQGVPQKVQQVEDYHFDWIYF